MKIEKISPIKLKVTLSQAELIEWNLDFDAMPRDPDAMRDVFLSILKKAEIETGFDIGGAQIMVEVKQNYNRDFVMFITVVSAELQDEAKRIARRVFKKDSGYTIKPKAQTNVPNCCIYCFSTFDDVCSAVLSLKFFQDAHSSLSLLNGKYYLTLTCEARDYLRHISSVFSEFGRRRTPSPLISGYISEHGELLMPDDAIETICKYFK